MGELHFESWIIGFYDSLLILPLSVGESLSKTR